MKENININQFGKTEDWYLERIGKIVFRKENTCNCVICLNVEKKGVTIEDKTHASYLFSVSCELNFDYYE